MRLGLLHAEGQQQHAQHGRHRGHPEHRPEVAGPQHHQSGSQQGAGKGAHGVQRLAQAKRRAAHGGRRQIGHQRIARRTPDALAEAVQQPGAHQQAHATSQREQGLAQRAQAIAQQGQALAPAKSVAPVAGEHLDDQRQRLGQALDQADGGGAGTQRAHHEQGQQAVDHLR